MRLEATTRHRSDSPNATSRPPALGVLAAVVAVAVPTIAIPFAEAQTATPADEELVLRVGVVADLNTDNPWAVEAGSDWTAVTIQYDMMLKFALRGSVAGAEPRNGM